MSLPYRVSSQGQMASLLHLRLFTLAVTPQEHTRPHDHYFLQVSQRLELLHATAVKLAVCLTMLTFASICLKSGLSKQVLYVNWSILVSNFSWFGGCFRQLERKDSKYVYFIEMYLFESHVDVIYSTYI